MKLKITSIKRWDKDREGKPLITKDNRPYVRLVIGAEGYEKTLSGFDSDQTKDWQVGQEVEVEVEQKGEYLNFRLPKKSDEIAKRMEKLENDLMSFKLEIRSELKAFMEESGKPKYQTPEEVGINTEDEPPF